MTNEVRNDLTPVLPLRLTAVTFVGLGLHPGMGATHFLPLAVGHQIASRMMLTVRHARLPPRPACTELTRPRLCARAERHSQGEVISGAEAARLGVVAEATEGDDGACLRRATELAAQMAAQAPIAVRTTVRSLRLASSAGLDRALWREADAQAQCYGSGECNAQRTPHLPATPNNRTPRSGLERGRFRRCREAQACIHPVRGFRGAGRPLRAAAAHGISKLKPESHCSVATLPSLSNCNGVQYWLS